VSKILEEVNRLGDSENYLLKKEVVDQVKELEDSKKSLPKKVPLNPKFSN